MRLAHAAIGVDDLSAAQSFYADVLGFRVHAASPEALHLRAPGEFDAWSLKLVAMPTGGLITFGFRVLDPDGLEELRALHARLGLATQDLPDGHEPGRGPALRVQTPGGHLVDFYHEVEEVALYDDDGVPRSPSRSTHLGHGARLERLDHVNLRVPSIQAGLDYWSGELGLRASEIRLDDDGGVMIAWLRRGGGTHDVALGAFARPGFHHVAYTLPDVSALSAAADLLADAGLESSIEYGPGRHGATNASMMYVKDPAGNRVELYTGDYLRDVDRPPIVWTPEAYARKGLLWWGHEPPASFREPGDVLVSELAAVA